MQEMEHGGIAKQILEEHQLFMYPSETDLIFSAAYVNWKTKKIEIGPEFTDLFYTAAAEFALIRQAYTPRFPRLELPIEVLPQDAKLALMKADTTLSDPCYETIERLRSGDIRGDDVFLFAGDSLKFERILGDEQKQISFLSDAISCFETLDRYQRDEFFYPLLKDFFDSPLLYLESILWKLQIDILKFKKPHLEISSDIAAIIEEGKARFKNFLS